MIRKKKKEGGSEKKGGGGSPGSAPAGTLCCGLYTQGVKMGTGKFNARGNPAMD